MRTLRAAAPVVAAALTTALLAAPAHAAADLSITSVSYAGGCGGDLVQLCSDELVAVEFTDPTPGSAYRLRVGGDPAVDAGADTFHPARLDDGDGNGNGSGRDVRGFAGLPLRTADVGPTDYDGRTLRLTVEQLDDHGGVVEASATSSFAVHLVQRPDPRTSGLDLQPSVGTWAIVAGRHHAVKYDGTWQPGAVFTKEVGLGSPSGRSVRLLREDGATSPDLAFTVPRAYVGWRLQAVVHGAAPGAAGVRIGWPASIPAGGYRVVAAQPRGWVRGHGARVGRTRVGSTVRLGRPTFSAEGRARKLSVRYQWLRAGVAIPGARSARHVVTAADRGRKVSLRVTYLEKGYADRSATVAFGTVRG